MPGKEPYCLVLGGGGAKGVYHAGVWKALKELRIPVNAFIGNSVGALIGAILAQGDDEALDELTDTIELDSILDVPNELMENGRLRLKSTRLPFLRGLTRDVMEHRGISTEPLRRLLQTYLDEDRLRNSSSDFGMQTFNLSDMKPGQVWDGESGFIHLAVDKHLKPSPKRQAFLCGPPLMIEAVTAVLREKGLSEAEIFYDKFD